MLKRVLLLVGCVALLLLSWSTVLAMDTPVQKQAVLIRLANEEIANETPFNAIEYLTQAVNYSTSETFDALETLKNIYDKLGYAKEYFNVLERQVSRADCKPDVFKELADYYIEKNKLMEAFDVLNTGIGKTGDAGLIEFYEQHRYTYTFSRESFEDVTAYHNGGIQIKLGGLWGLANTTGGIIIPCEYEQLSTVDTVGNGSIVALRDDRKVVTLNMKNQVVAILNADIKQIGGFSQNVVSLQLSNDKWVLANNKLLVGETQYDGIGTAMNSAIAVKMADGWGVSALDGKVIIPFEYGEIIADELGRSYAQGAAFVKKDGRVYLYAGGVLLPEAYEDAQPFTNDGWAAVKKDGKWGYIDVTGTVKIDFQFENALSFSQGLAAVKLSSQTINVEPEESDEENVEVEAKTEVVELWGYINTSGKTVIEPVFYKAKSFTSGNAPVLTRLGWQFISLVEYQKGSGF